MQYDYDRYPNYQSPEINNYEQQYPYEPHQQEGYYNNRHSTNNGHGYYDDGPPPQAPAHHHHQYHDQPPPQQQQEFDRLPSVRSPTYYSGAHNDAVQMEAQNQQKAHLASLPHVDLPPYELPPPFIPKSERRVHANYRSNVEMFRNRTVELRRNKPSDPLGFNIRGGAEFRCGVFVSKVLSRTNADKAGLQEGDQILFANNESFLNISAPDAMKCLKRKKDVDMTVKFFPYAYDKSYDKCKSKPIG